MKNNDKITKFVMMAAAIVLFLCALALVIGPARGDHQEEQYVQYYPEYGEHCATISNDMMTVRAFEALMHGTMTARAYYEFLLERAKHFGLSAAEAQRMARGTLMKIMQSCSNVTYEEGL